MPRARFAHSVFKRDRILIALLRFAVLAMILAYAAPIQAAQPVPLNTFTFTAARGQRPGATAHITRIWVRTSPFGHSGQTGSLLIHYSDGASLVLWRAPHQNVMTLQANSPSGIFPPAPCTCGLPRMGVRPVGRAWPRPAASPTRYPCQLEFIARAKECCTSVDRGCSRTGISWVTARGSLPCGAPRMGRRCWSTRSST